MINRELIRIKVVQLTYAYYQNGNCNIENAEKELLFSLDKAYDLYHSLLDLMVAVTRVARQRVDVAKARHERGEGAKPSERFTLNKFALQLEENATLNEWRGRQKFTWDDDVTAVRSVLDSIEASEAYAEYMAAADEPDYAADRELWRKLYKTFVVDNEEIDKVLEERSLYWNDDKYIVDTFVIKTIKRFTEKSDADQELLPEFKDMADRDFAVKLFRTSILNSEQYQHYMTQTTKNWDFSRLAYMDVVIMQIAIAEMLSFPAIPVSVSINEYVNLAKVYSTPKSWRYVNGMLDSIARYLNETGKMLKPLPER
ncbi:transcription antitermination factor NusB [Prevotella sp. PINT]|uniref:transcription antitermination factor NusB n=1 Tax=Palleniella intestinalis TaxID=2736291 RepID=UPI001556FBB0|nr:transcription antitermination factor NusB [Palleniella intestinalis]NPD81296.1 transcription antitermination factor NusB [Palleniella intestinalis]